MCIRNIYIYIIYIYIYVLPPYEHPSIHTFVMRMLFNYAPYIDFMFFVLCNSIEVTVYFCDPALYKQFLHYVFKKILCLYGCPSNDSTRSLSSMCTCPHMYTASLTPVDGFVLYQHSIMIIVYSACTRWVCLLWLLKYTLWSLWWQLLYNMKAHHFTFNGDTIYGIAL